jgi:guanylate kinase
LISDPNSKLILFCGPSGSGKTTIVHALLNKHPEFIFSISATTRKKRNNETDGVDYHFFSEEEFKAKITEGAFLEWEEVYPGRFYGTLKKDVEDRLQQSKIVLFDVDVKGGLSIKKYFGKNLLDIFIKPPSLSALKTRLLARASETAESLEKRLEKSGLELSYADQFSYIIVNDELRKALHESELLVNDFLNRA